MLRVSGEVLEVAAMVLERDSRNVLGPELPPPEWDLLWENL